MWYYVELLTNGLLTGTLYSLIALGFVLIYKASDVINFAQGELVMFAGYVVAACVQLYGLPLLVSIAAGVIAMIVLGFAVEQVVLKHLIGRPVVAVIMATIGLGAFLRGLAPLLWGIETKNLSFGLPQDPYMLGEVMVGPAQIFAACVSLVCIALVGWFFAKSRTGIALRAIADDQQAAMAMGIDLERYFALTWIMVGVIAVLAGTLWTFAAGSGFGVVLLGLKVFPIVIIGGLDSIPGTIVGAVAIGVLESVAAGYLDPWVGAGLSNVAPYLVLIAVLFARPCGLFGRADVVRV